MSEPAPPNLAHDTAVHPAAGLSPESIRSILADFQQWLTTAPAPHSAIPPDEEPVDLHSLIAQFVALRHEVNLQTRATRTQQELNGESLRQLTAALNALKQSETATPQSAPATGEETTVPLLKTLIELHDALGVGGRELGKVRETVASQLKQIADLAAPNPAITALRQSALSAQPARSAGWRRWFGASEALPPAGQSRKDVDAAVAALDAQEKERSRRTMEHLDRLAQLIESMATGYSMSLRRIEHALQRHDLEPLTVVGRPFDPEQMEVLDVVYNSGRPSGEVVEEVRRGYLRGGRVFRCAQVRVAKG
jgi:molecular chaperone GrpE